jgi:AAA+ superfamily predicted ATPase
MEMLQWTVTHGLRDGLVPTSPPIIDTEHPAAALFHLAARHRPAAVAMLDLVAHLKDERTLRTLRETLARFDRLGGHIILIDHVFELPLPVRSLATPFEIQLPDTKEIESIIRDTLRARNEICPIQVDLGRKDLQAIVRNLRGLTRRQARQVILDAVCTDQRLDVRDVNAVLAQKRRHLQASGLLEFVESPVSVDEIGGLRRMKYWLEQRKEALGEEAAEFGIEPPRGVLMLGVQGAGKSLAAKAVATAWQRPLLRLDVGALYDKFIGESEKRLRDALHQAEMMSPIILWIDEIEKAFASAASHSADGGLSKRMFGALLTWMQEHEAPVFLIATANDIEALPPELLRKGRFDEIFFVDLPDADARKTIFSIHLRKRKRDPAKFDLERLALTSEGFSGAEIEQAVISSLHDAFATRSELMTDHMTHTLKSSPPLSVTMAERIAELRRWARGRCVPAD